MQVAPAGFVLTVLLAFGARADDWDYTAIPADYQVDPRRTKISLHLDKSNENDVEFVHEVADALKKYRDVKLETENVALRNQPSREEDPAKVLADKIVQVLIENPRSNVVAIRTMVEPKHSQHEENEVISDEAPEAPPMARQDHAGRCRY